MLLWMHEKSDLQFFIDLHHWRGEVFFPNGSKSFPTPIPPSCRAPRLQAHLNSRNIKRFWLRRKKLFWTLLVNSSGQNLLKMKTPERSHTSRVPPLYSPFAQKSFCLLWIERHTQMRYLTSRDVMTSYYGITWRHDVILSHHIKSHHRP